MRPLAATALLTALALAACSAAGNRPVESANPFAGGRYVAMGSSFAAGSGLGEPKPDTPPLCGRSFSNYATLLAEKMRLTLYDVTCGGATTDHILGSQNGLAPQIDAVTADTDLVTVTIGGNDINYAGNLFAASCKARGGFSVRGTQIPCMAPNYPSEQDYQRLAANMTEIARQVRSRAPRAKLVFVQYVSLVPEKSCDAVDLPADDIAAARETARRLSAITAKAARENGAMLLETDRLSANHTPCDAEPWSIGFPSDLDPAQGIPWHPNRAGMRAIAELTARLIAN